MTGPFSGVVTQWRQALDELGMDSQGMFTVPLDCVRCGKRLNGDGNHPAEIHAGTFTGLCYGCTAAGPYIEKVAVLDGARKVSWPPFCPSWRRDREGHIAYPGCGGCNGQGIIPGTRVMLDRPGDYCPACTRRYDAHPLRAMDSRYGRLLRERAQAVYDRALRREAGLPARCSAKRARAATAALDPRARAALAQPILERYGRLRARHETRVERLHISQWRLPLPGEQL
jgi:hypothetical protein